MYSQTWCLTIYDSVGLWPWNGRNRVLIIQQYSKHINLFWFAVIWVVGSAVIPLLLTIKNDWPAAPILEWVPLQPYLLALSLFSDLLNVNFNQFFSVSGTQDYNQYNYIVPWCRFSPYICGIIVGYALHVTKHKPFKMAKVNTIQNIILKSWFINFNSEIT